MKDLKKLFRKKLMTGGAVFELEDSLSEEHQLIIFGHFLPDATEHNIQGMVLKQLAQHPKLSPLVLAKLKEQGFSFIDQVLEEQARIKSDADVEEMPAVGLRRYFLRNIGASKESVIARKLLCSARNLPNDLICLLKRDPSSDVRFGIRKRKT